MTIPHYYLDTPSVLDLEANKGILPEVLLQEMRESFARSEEFLDLENTAAGNDRVLEQKEETHHMIRKATPEQPDLILEALRVMQGAGNMTGLAATAAVLGN